MPSTILTVKQIDPSKESPSAKLLPPLLQTPHGLALIELQGSINTTDPLEPAHKHGETHSIPLGHLTFPDGPISKHHRSYAESNIVCRQVPKDDGRN